MSKSINELDNNVSIVFKLVLALNSVLTTPIHAVNTNVNDVPAIPTGIPTTVACEAIIKLPNDADSTICLFCLFGDFAPLFHC